MLRSAALIAVSACCAAPAVGQQEEVISLFGHGRGANPGTPLLADNAGNLYGGAWIGGKASDPLGTVFELVRHGQRWSNTALYGFSLLDSGFPDGGLIAKGHSLFGTTNLPCGTVFRLTLRSGFWRETTLHSFGGSGDGCAPVGTLTTDSSDNLYGSTAIGGANEEGEVFELSPSGASYQILYSFSAGKGGNRPQGVVLDATGTSLFGVAGSGGKFNGGVAFELTQNSGKWHETVLHSFGATGDGSGPWGEPVADSSGNLYGTTGASGADGAGTVYELSPSGKEWTETLLYSFTGGNDGNQPRPGVTLYKGALYGVTESGGSAGGGGTVFKLTQSGGTWSEAVLHSFPPPGTSDDGAQPFAHPIVEGGTIYGTTVAGGRNNKGTAYRIVE